VKVGKTEILVIVFFIALSLNSYSKDKTQGMESLSLEAKKSDVVKKKDTQKVVPRKTIRKKVRKKDLLEEKYLMWAKTLSYEERFYLAKSWYIVATAYKSAKREEKYQRAYRRAIAIFPEIERLYTPYEKNSKK
jgi:hypothetical protein